MTAQKFARCFLVLTLLTSVGNVVTDAAGIPSHPHGPDWIAWEQDGDEGVGRADHDHTKPQASENGDTAHNHYRNQDFGGWDDFTQRWSSYGVWIDRTGFIDQTAPFDTNMATTILPHGWINADLKPRFKFVDGAVNAEKWGVSATAQSAKPLIESAFSEWSKIKAEESPVLFGGTGKKLKTGFGFDSTLGANFEISVLWKDIDDNSGGGVSGGFSAGDHTSANPFTLTFDSSYNWDFTANAAASDTTKWHFLSVALHEVGHLSFLEHQSDNDGGFADLMDPSVGEPVSVLDADGSWRYDSYVDVPNSEADYFSGVKLTTNGRATTSVAIQDFDSPDGIKSLYSIPIPEPAALLLVSMGGMLGVMFKRR